MGARGTPIFSDDTAADTRDAFTDFIADGLTPAAATRRASESQMDVIWMGLIVQAHHGLLGLGEGLKPATTFIAALSVGYRPTFGGTQLRVEAFLLDFEGDLYQQRLELRFIRYLHPDIKFPTTDDLVRQLHQDVADTRRIVSA